MSYCRWGSGDAYMYGCDVGIVCCACTLSTHRYDKTFTKRSQALAHLREHEKAGGKIPAYAKERLILEIKELGDEYGQVRACGEDSENGRCDNPNCESCNEERREDSRQSYDSELHQGGAAYNDVMFGD